jgi:hypothetical protein
MKWFNKEKYVETTAKWTDKNELTITVGSDIEEGDNIIVNIKHPSIDIYPGEASIKK